MRIHAGDEVVLDGEESRLDASEKLALVSSRIDQAALKGRTSSPYFARQQFKLDLKDQREEVGLSPARSWRYGQAEPGLRPAHQGSPSRREKVQSLAKDLDANKLALSASGKQVDAQTAKLADVERLLKLLGSEKIELLAKLKTADLRVNILESETKDSQKRLDELTALKAALDKKIAGFDKDLVAAQAILSKTKADALSKVKALENRFAGITLDRAEAGRLPRRHVGQHGSWWMRTRRSPMKWPIVCDTVAKIMTSLPGPASSSR